MSRPLSPNCILLSQLHRTDGQFSLTHQNDCLPADFRPEPLLVALNASQGQAKLGGMEELTWEALKFVCNRPYREHTWPLHKLGTVY